jgi:GT2 family glycosyltransferase
MQSLPHLLKQTAPIDEIRLYIPRKYRRFPDYDGTLPEVPKEVRIIRPAEDLGPASKVLFAADDLRGTDCDIIYCDDDRVYEPDWFARMLYARKRHQNRCVATVTLDRELAFRGTKLEKGFPPHKGPQLFRKDLGYRVKRFGQIMRKLGTGEDQPKIRRGRYGRPGFAAIAEGFGAVLVKPDFFDAAAYDIPPVIWSVDDVWLSGHMARKGIPIWQAAGFSEPHITDSSEVMPLYKATVAGVDRNDANIACIKYMQDTYGVWA